MVGLGVHRWGRGEEFQRFTLSSAPTIAVQENGTYGGQGKAAGCVPLAALLCVGQSHALTPLSANCFTRRRNVASSHVPTLPKPLGRLHLAAFSFFAVRHGNAV